MAGGMVGDRFGPFACIDARDRLPSVAATREHVPPVLPAVELPISRKRSDHRAAVEALIAPQALREKRDDLLAVEPAVFDEDHPRVPSGHRATGNEQVRHIGLERLRVVLGP